MAQSVKCPTFVLGHDLTVHEFEPHIGLSAVSAEPASDPLSAPPPAPPPHAQMLVRYLKNKTFKKFYLKRIYNCFKLNISEET